MDIDRTTGEFSTISRKIKETWGRLSDGDIVLYNEEEEKFYVVLRQHYGITRERAKEKIKGFERLQALYSIDS